MSSNVTLRTLSLGAQDTTTGWYAKTYADTTIQMPIVPKGTFYIAGNTGHYTRYTFTGFTNDAISEGDQIVDAATRYFEIRTVQPWSWLDSLEFYECELAYRQFPYDRPSTSGTWLLESALNLDPRYRQKKLLDDYLTAANMKEDDNATNATYITTMGKADYSLSKVFIGKSVDLIFCIESATMKPILGHDMIARHNEYDVAIGLYAIDKTTITATRLIRAAEHELQRIAETYPTGSIRSIGREEPNEQDLGECILWSKKVTMHYIIGVSG